VPLLDELDDAAREMGAVNCVMVPHPRGGDARHSV
jgi:shikimate 5-dehydrogenase